MSALELGGPTDTAQYGPMDPERDQGPDVTSCLVCGRLAIDHTEGRWSVYGTCPRKDLIVQRSRTRPQVVRVRFVTGGQVVRWAVVHQGVCYPFGQDRSLALWAAHRPPPAEHRFLGWPPLLWVLA